MTSIPDVLMSVGCALYALAYERPNGDKLWKSSLLIILIAIYLTAKKG
jgi:hypothetical protein